MEPNGPAVASATLPVSVFLKSFNTDEASCNQAMLTATGANRQIALSHVNSTKITAQCSYANSAIKASLENETVWSRFHTLGTEMILTKQGRRMFPCCRLKLSGLEPEKKYLLVMDIVPLDDFTYKWNGKIWEPAGPAEPHVTGKMCIHPDSPTLGHRLMKSPVSFYKVKLTDNHLDQDGCLVLHPMQRYQPRLHIVTVIPDSEEPFTLDGPNVQMFAFPKTEFFAVKSYQNPQITQLKIDCNPFAMAFREDRKSICLLKDKFRLCPISQSPDLNLARTANHSEQQSNDKAENEHEIKVMIGTSGYPNGVDSCKDDEPSKENNFEVEDVKQRLTKLAGFLNKQQSDDNSGEEIVIQLSKNNLSHAKGVTSRGNEDEIKQHLTKPELHEHISPLDIEPNETISLQELPLPPGPVSPISSTESLKQTSKDAVNSKMSYACKELPSESSTTELMSPEPTALPQPEPPACNAGEGNKHTTPFRRKCFRRARKAKSKWWSNVKYAKPAPVISPPDASMLPDLEDVDGMLFVSFTRKDVLNIHVQNMEHVASPTPLSPTLKQLDIQELEVCVANVSLPMEERISKLESALILHLKQLKHRQVLHPLLQEVGMKLGLLDPALAVDLQYLGVRLPFPPAHSPSEAVGSFVSRTGKTNDPTKIKGWREKFNTSTIPSAPDFKKNSAFCSDMLDKYLENEEQKISDRVSVLSTTFTCPLSYELPSKSSSYMVTLDSRLKARTAQAYPNEVCCSLPNNVQLKTPRRNFPSSRGRGKRVARSSQSPQNQQPSGLPSRPEAQPREAKGTRMQSVRGCPTSASAKMQIQFMLQDMEDEGFFHGRSRTRITRSRANFALSSLFNSKVEVNKKYEKKDAFNFHYRNKEACPEIFCRLGCVCDSLNREIRGPTHCHRVQCMFDCSCFKHKVLLFHPQQNTDVQKCRKRSLLAYPIDDPERGARPPPASCITKLWKRKVGEEDPEPLFVPQSVHASTKRLRYARSTSHMGEDEKDPVYLYFESMMTCARVREYNSNPPPQVHMFPAKKDLQGPEKLKHSVEEAFSPNIETNAAAVHPAEPEPIKLLEIVSECNWEPHRSIVLSALFSHMNSDLFSKPLCFGDYKMQHLSTTMKQGNTCSTLIYKVCVSRAEEKNKTEVLMLEAKRTKRCTNVMDTQTKQGSSSFRKSSSLPHMVRKKTSSNRSLNIFPLVLHASPACYLKAVKKKPSGFANGLIKVNGNAYNKAVLLLGQMGALHSANRVAAFVTGRLRANPQKQPQLCPNTRSAEASFEVPKAKRASKQAALQSGGNCLPASACEPYPASKRARASEKCKAPSKLGEANIPPKENVSAALEKPSISASAPSAHKAPVLSANGPTMDHSLPPGRPVVLQQVPGILGPKYLCQINGQTLQLMPIPSETYAQSPLSSNNKVIHPAANASLPKETTPSEYSAKPLAIILPKVLSLSGARGMNIASGTPAINLHSSFPGKTSTFSFRIVPPNGEDKSAESQQGARVANSSSGPPSMLALPGGFTLVKLPVGLSHAAPAASEPTQNDKRTENPVSPSSTPSLEQSCKTSASDDNTLRIQTSNCNLGQEDTASLRDTDNGGTSQSGDEEKDDKTNMTTPGKYSWTPKGAKTVPKSMDETSELKNSGDSENDLEDWSAREAERLRRIKKSDSFNEKDEDMKKKINNNSDPLEVTDLKIGVDKNPSKGKQSNKVMENSKKLHGNRTILIHDKYCDSQEALPINAVKYNHNSYEEQQIKKYFSVHLKTEPQEEPVEALSLSPPNVNKQFVVRENGLSVVIKVEPYDELSEMDNAANQADNKKRDFAGVNNSPLVNKEDMKAQDLEKESKSGIFIKVESFSDVPHTDNEQTENALCLTSKQGPSSKETPTKQPGLSRQYLDSPIKTDTMKLEEDSSRSINTEYGALCTLSNDPLILTPKAPLPETNLTKERHSQMSRTHQHAQENSRLKNISTCSQSDQALSPNEEHDCDSDDKSESNSDVGSSDDFESFTDCETDNREDSDEHKDIDIESLEENEHKITSEPSQILNMNHEVRIRAKFQHRRHASGRTGHKMDKRIKHTQKERRRREEMFQAFTSLKRALNVEEKVRMYRHDILHQAQLTIRALKTQSRSLEEMKIALLQRQSDYIGKITQLSGKTDIMAKKTFEENLNQKIDIKTLVNHLKSNPKVNSRRLDSEGNKLPPRLGLWKSPNYQRKRSRNSSEESSTSTTVTVSQSLGKNKSTPASPGVSNVEKGDIPSVIRGALDLRTGAVSSAPNSDTSTSSQAGKRPLSLPRIMLQYFGKNDKVVKLISASVPVTCLPQAPKSAKSSQNVETVKRGESTMMQRGKEGATVSKDSNKEDPESSLSVSKHSVWNKTSNLDKDQQPPECLVKRTERSKGNLVMEKAVSEPKRELRSRSRGLPGSAKRGRRRKRVK